MVFYSSSSLSLYECPNVTVGYLWGQGCTVQCSHGLAGVSSASCDSISCVVTAGHRWSPVTWTRIWTLQIQYRTVQYSTASPVWSPGPGSGDSHVSGGRAGWRLLMLQMERAAENASSVSGDRDGGWTETLIYSLGLDTHFIL